MYNSRQWDKANQVFVQFPQLYIYLYPLAVERLLWEELKENKSDINISEEKADAAEYKEAEQPQDEASATKTEALEGRERKGEHSSGSSFSLLAILYPSGILQQNTLQGNAK